MNPKIFCIGLNKTGTTSLDEAFKILNYRSVHFGCEKGNIKNIIQNNYRNSRKLLQDIEEYDAYSDWNHPSTNHLYEKFYEQYPGSKFILNTRDLNAWLTSREKHVKRIPNLKELQKKFPNSTWYHMDKNEWKNEFIDHHKNVKAFFKNKEKDLLIFDVCAGDEWKKLCGFLDVPIPDIKFPAQNKAPQKSMFLRLKSFLRPLKKRLFKNR